ncbi:hypothetical protein [Alkalinema sp. FACHB-956]|uniref:tetratricopeptide repeat protein n=1 Tax=Alkalinema sp. FACHB-956 TaxID=2692768 RepID=UPI001683A9B4|nr:hypothetical protein [Alkalinema sp. FACHB-956]MBD2328753.1 hypothetical protein [Alkalinema sp. FACHB-956]
MLLADRHSNSGLSVTEIAHSLSSRNRQVYARLRMTLGLRLRRQLLIAVCDDMALRDRTAALLEQESRHAGSQFLCIPTHSDSSELAATSQLAISVEPISFVSLNLKTAHPDLRGQIAQWLQHQPTRPIHPVFQILGIEKLTRQPAHIQRAFLNHLRAFGRGYGETPWSLVVWVSRPWIRSIQQSAPEFWRWHTGIFEFEGDPFPQLAETGSAVDTVAPPPPATFATHSPRLGTPAVPSQTSLTCAENDLADYVLAAVVQSSDMSAAIAREEIGSDNGLGEPTTDYLTAPSGETETETEVSSQEELPLQPNCWIQQIEYLRHQQPLRHSDLAAAYRHLGDWYRDRADQDPSLDHFTLGIQAYAQALEHLSEDPQTSSEVLNDQANLYWLLSRLSSASVSPEEPLVQAIATYESAIALINPVDTPLHYAMVQNNLGAAYGDLAQYRDPAANLQRSIYAYIAAIQHRTADQDPQRYAAIQNNLGTTYWSLAQCQQPIANLQQAIAAYSAALPFYDPEQQPLPYAMIQNNLGTAYWNLSQCENLNSTIEQTSQNLLQLAISAYRVALLYRTPDVVPTGYAATQNNLGTAYWHLANDPTTHPDHVMTYLQDAIVAYLAALDTVESLNQSGGTSLNFDPWATHHNLASAYHQAVTQYRAPLETATRSEYLAAALHHHLQAWSGWRSNADLQEAALDGIVQVVRTYHEQLGLPGQNIAISKLPATLLPQVMQQI